MSCYQQVCFAHDLQLAVVDILYKKNIEREEEHQEITSNESDTDDEDTNDSHEEQAVADFDNMRPEAQNYFEVPLQKKPLLVMQMCNVK
ncbi:hypothetical protein AVEN_251482-1 [Araneus ventricosus]|uniref:Uncharacterized protein n=1 Tax=Araneus ventricosus TaxID=182803 RepID=A0A4Y2R3U6_ARAVE|nr:hypothetical protein AVEN_251482-1 [Araneus ventricosus]